MPEQQQIFGGRGDPARQKQLQQLRKELSKVMKEINSLRFKHRMSRSTAGRQRLESQIKKAKARQSQLQRNIDKIEKELGDD